MNKVLKGLVAVAATAAMAVAGFAGASTATAVEGETVTAVKTSYTISFPTDAKYQGHTYEVYQIFTGDFDGKVLSNVKYGENGNKTAGTEVTAEELKQLTDVNVESKTDQEKLDVIKTFAKLENPVATLTKIDTSYEAAPGYYLIKDKDGSVSSDANDASTLYITKVVGDVIISPKSDVPSFEKKVKDINDTTGDTSEWQDSADYDFGDKVPFQLKAKLPSNYADYKTYYLAFHDVEEKDLSFNADSVKVAVDGTQITSGYEVKTTGLSDKCTFEVVFTDLKTAVAAAKAGSEITVNYTSTLTKQAVLGNEGNVNKARLQFSNNPNSEQGGESTPTGKTPWDNVIVFTYKVVVNKVKENKEALKGAAFKLEKKLKGGTTTLVKEFTAGEDTSFTFSGLDDGDYILTETTTPAGYNTIKPITFTVTADHKITWGDTDNRTDILTSLSGTAASGEISFTADETNSSLTTSVVNVKGSNLPSTGGMGTVLLYVAGIAVFVLAGVTLVMALRRRNA